MTVSPKVLVVGSGAIGLRTAVELVRRKVSVVLQSPVHPLHFQTCSMGAGGLWMPFRCDDPRVDRWAIETLNELLTYADNPNQEQQQQLVEILPTVCLQREHGGPTMEDFLANEDDYQAVPGGTTKSEKLPVWTADSRIRFQHLTVEQLTWQNQLFKLRIPPQDELVQAGYLHAWLFHPPIVNAPRMLEHLLEQVVSTSNAEVDVETGEYFESVPHMRETAARFGCQAVVNCTGLGAAAICNEQDEMVGARGVLLQFDRESCVRRPAILDGNNTQDALVMIDQEPWGSETMPCYMIPRGDKIVVGGSYLKGDTETAIRPEERERLLQNATRMGIDVKESKLVGEWTGFRPYRPAVRCELDTEFSTDDITVAHNYGHGGSGWTVNVGAANQCVDVLLSSLASR